MLLVLPIQLTISGLLLKTSCCQMLVRKKNPILIPTESLLEQGSTESSPPEPDSNGSEGVATSVAVSATYFTQY